MQDNILAKSNVMSIVLKEVEKLFLCELQTLSFIGRCNRGNIFCYTFGPKCLKMVLRLSISWKSNRPVNFLLITFPDQLFLVTCDGPRVMVHPSA